MLHQATSTRGNVGNSAALPRARSASSLKGASASGGKSIYHTPTVMEAMAATARERERERRASGHQQQQRTKKAAEEVDSPHRRPSAAAAADAAPEPPMDRFKRDAAILTEHNAAADEVTARLWERKRYSFASREELTLRIATTMTTGRYELPSFLTNGGSAAMGPSASTKSTTDDGNDGGGKSNAFMGRVGAATQTHNPITRDVGLGDGDIDTMAPERSIDVPVSMPEVSEFPILSLPQQLEAERRIVSLLARIEEEMGRCADEARRAAQQQQQGAGGDDKRGANEAAPFYDTAEWEGRMLAAVTTRMRQKHGAAEEGGQDLRSYLRRHKETAEAAAREAATQHLSAAASAGADGSPSSSAHNNRRLLGSDAYGGTSTGTGPSSAMQDGVIPQPLTPAVQHILKVRPLLKGNVDEMRRLVADSKAARSAVGSPNGRDASPLGRHLTLNPDGSVAAAFGGPSAQFPTQIAGRKGAASSTGAKPLSRGMRIALSTTRYVTPRASAADPLTTAAERGPSPSSWQHPSGATSPALSAATASMSMGGTDFGGYGAGGGRTLPSRRRTAHADPQTSQAFGGGLGGSTSPAPSYGDSPHSLSLYQQQQQRYGDGYGFGDAAAGSRSGSSAAGWGGGGGGISPDHSPTPTGGGRWGGGGLGGYGAPSAASTLNAPSAASSPSPAHTYNHYGGDFGSAAELMNAGIGSPVGGARRGTHAPYSSHGHAASGADGGGGGAVAAAIGQLVNDDHSPTTRAGRRAAGNALIAGLDGLDEVKDRLRR